MNDVATHTTRGIQVDVTSHFLPSHSSPRDGRWVYGYCVTISNVDSKPATLRSRHWIISNADGIVSEVRGAGVVGEEPRLAKGESFSYTSGCPLDTPFGTMHGTYRFESDDGEMFDVKVPTFRLAMPYAVN